jgi:hypothetical protein
MVRDLLLGVGMRSPVVLVLLVPAFAGCTTYAQHRAALVPHATPLPLDGQPLPTSFEASFGADNLVDLVTPSKGDDTQGDVVPKQQLRANGMFRLGDNFMLGGTFQYGVAQNATVLSPSEPKIEGAKLAGAGLTLAMSAPTSEPGLRIGLAFETVIWSVPWVEYTTCIDLCSVPGYTYSERGNDQILVAKLAVIPSYKTGAMTYFGGLTAQNQPTITEKILTNNPRDDGKVRGGPFNLTAHAGVTVELGAGVRASAFLHQTLTRDPISYGPGIGMSLAIPLGSPRGPRRQVAPQPTPVLVPSTPAPLGPPGTTPGTAPGTSPAS